VPDGFGKLTTFIVTHVARRRADQPRYRELFLVFGHIDTGQSVFVVKQVFGQGFGQLRFTYTGRA